MEFGPFDTIEQIKQANKRLGHYWFDADTLAFFNTHVETGVLFGRYFVSSERDANDGPLGRAWDGKRRYTVRRANDDGSIGTVGEFGQYDTAAEAERAIKEVARG